MNRFKRCLFVLFTMVLYFIPMNIVSAQEVNLVEQPEVGTVNNALEIEPEEASGIPVAEMLTEEPESGSKEEAVPQTDPVMPAEDEIPSPEMDILAEEETPAADSSLAAEENPSPNVEDASVVEVRTFEELKQAIAEAGTEATTIKIMDSFDLTEKLRIGKDQQITLTANNAKVADEAWQAIEQPADAANRGEASQREIIEEARRRGEEAIKIGDLTNNPLPTRESGAVVIRRADNFVTDTLFEVIGELILGDKESALYIDGNSSVQTAFDDRGTMMDIRGKLRIINAILMGSKNNHGYTAPIKVKKGGQLIMDGGRISQNTSYEKIDPDYTRPTSAGAVYVDPGASFTMNNGLIDNNNGGITGGVFVGSLFGSADTAYFEMNGGLIVNNKSNTRFQSGGGITVYPAAKLTLNDGIVANNRSGSGGGIAVSDQFLSEFSNIVNREYANTPANYEKHLKENKSEASLKGGLIYKNVASTVGGGVYVDTNFVHFVKTMILDNRSNNFGGGVYVSFPPRIQILDKLLITENTARATWIDSFGGGNGGGLWNCPTGFVHIGDGHTVYVFNNKADGAGRDLTFSKKTKYFLLNKINIKDKFYSQLSPVTKALNIIKFIQEGKTGDEIPDHLSYTDLMVNLRAVYDDALMEEAWQTAQTFILGNTSRNGGGFGSNANLTTPEDLGDYNLRLEKIWDPSISSSVENKDVIVDIFIVPEDVDSQYVRDNYAKDPRLYKYGEITLNKDNQWSALFHQTPYADIEGLPANSLDKGLIFSAAELAKRGLKYLVIEQGNQYHVEVTERVQQDEQKIEAGHLVIKRIFSTDLGPDYDDEAEMPESKIYLYFKDQDQALTLIDHAELTEATQWQSLLKHPLLLNKINNIEYYGQDRAFIDYGEDWSKDIHGYGIHDSGYAVVLVRNADGTYTLRLPYLWIQDYDDTASSGFMAEQLVETSEIVQDASEHTFTLTNFEQTSLEVEKKWINEDKIPEKDFPKEVIVYLLKDGKKVVESYDQDGKPVYRQLILNKENQWQGRF
ncbi:hypothetical protein WJ437_03045 [Ignavigranum ruoffiae]|uniref:hypothetical protein n=2 Tax=Ignavigranum ruoffiae TaxID=89093 RepID=UPI003AFFAE24